MSNIVTFEQAVQLCELGFNKPCWRTYIITSKNLIPKGKDGRMNKNSELCKGYYSAPTVSSALDWIREEKGIMCAVELERKTNRFHATTGYGYGGSYIDDKEKEILLPTQPTHPLAESALLTAVLEYLIEKEK